LLKRCDPPNLWTVPFMTSKRNYWFWIERMYARSAVAPPSDTN
jgi:hypothetical protein